jgi:phospholipase C
MYVLSPWSRGGWVHSEVADHTSVIRFLERRFGVMEPNISPWRRAVCSDLTTAFDFATPNDMDFARLLPDTTDARARAAAIPHQPTPVLPADRARPRQEPGEKPTRSTRYRLSATCDLSADRSEATLTFSVQGELAAVFHVYDRLHLDRIPRRYTVGAGESLQGVWALAPDAGRYDLWVLGPSGLVGHFVG